ncbi:MAG: hypothetical protein HRU32_03285, partial [Rhodobacteraceae bacterium]|nr:hypothetical protein [Paracoccaceae bacterium]
HLEGHTQAGMGLKIAAIFGGPSTVTTPEVALSATGLPLEPVQVAAFNKSTIARRDLPLDESVSMPISDHELNAFGLPCEPSLAIEKSGASVARVSYASPCKAMGQVELRYGDLEFTDVLDFAGHLILDVPVLGGDRTLMVTSPDGDVLTAQMPSSVNGLAWRAALNWRGETGLSIHAYEFGANFGEPGHVVAGAVRPSSLGRIMRLGDATLTDGAVAEVYGLPLLGNAPTGTVELVVEAQVTPTNCGRDITAKVWNPQAAGGFRPVDVSVSMPDCTTIGETMMLKNLIQDLKLAAN